MDQLRAIANSLTACLAAVIERLFGCPHRKTTIPITKRAGLTSETYVVCLECGRRFEYDWAKMRIAKRRCSWPADAKKGNP